MSSKQIQPLLALLDEAYAGPAWHGPCLRGSLRGVTHREAAWRPAPGRHSIWELTIHAAYWKYAVRRRLLGEKRGKFAEQGSNWFERQPGTNEKSAKAWRRDLALLGRTHQELCAAVSQLTDAALDRSSRGATQKPRRMIAGIALHDVYHAGQIQLLKRLVRKR
jgi:uncharacterized damage-inducible protein DinB